MCVIGMRPGKQQGKVMQVATHQATDVVEMSASGGVEWWWQWWCSSGLRLEQEVYLMWWRC